MIFGYDWTMIVWMYNQINNMKESGMHWGEIARTLGLDTAAEAMKEFSIVSRLYNKVTH